MQRSGGVWRVQASSNDQSGWLQVVDGMAGWGEAPASESKQEASESKPEAKKEEGTDAEPRGMDAVRAILAGQNYFKVRRLALSQYIWVCRARADSRS
jgi:hypothetical protein